MKRIFIYVILIVFICFLVPLIGVYKFENEERTPTTESLVRLADFYNVSIDYILMRSDCPEINQINKNT